MPHLSVPAQVGHSIRRRARKAIHYSNPAATQGTRATPMQTSPEVEQQVEAPTAFEAAPVEEIAAAIRQVDALEGMRDEDYLWLATHGKEGRYPPGATIFREGETPMGMYIMLRGEVHVRRKQSGNISFFIARMGQISGILPYSRMKGYGGTGFAVGEVWTLDIPREMFPDMLAAIPSMAPALCVRPAQPHSRSHSHGDAGGEADRPRQARR